MNENERISGVGERGRRIKKLKKGMMLIKDAVMRADMLKRYLILLKKSSIILFFSGGGRIVFSCLFEV